MPLNKLVSPSGCYRFSFVRWIAHLERMLTTDLRRCKSLELLVSSLFARMHSMVLPFRAAVKTRRCVFKRRLGFLSGRSVSKKTPKELMNVPHEGRFLMPGDVFVHDL